MLAWLAATVGYEDPQQGYVDEKEQEEREGMVNDVNFGAVWARV